MYLSFTETDRPLLPLQYMNGMERWTGILKASLNPNNGAHFNVAASLCICPSSKTLTVPSANAIFFGGDRVQGTGDPVIEKISDSRNIAEILVSKLGLSVNAWVVEASTFNGPFAVYKEFIPSVNSRGEPKCYDADGFPASTTTVSLLSKCVQEAKNLMSSRVVEPSLASVHLGAFTSCPCYPRTIILGFSKGGTVLNQLLAELAYSTPQPAGAPSDIRNGEHGILPMSKESFLDSISEIHYVDVGLNSVGSHLTEEKVVKKIAQSLLHGGAGIRFTFHGTPRQWFDPSRPWIRNEKERLLQLLQNEASQGRGKLEVHEKYYFANTPPNLRMHFEIIENLEMS